MAVYDGVPSIRLEGDQKKAVALIPEATVLLQQVQAFITRAGVPTYSSTYRVDDDSYIYVLCAGGQNIIHISVAPDVVDQTYEELEEPISTLFPDFYSGLVIGGIMGKIEIEKADNTGKTVEYAVVNTFIPTPTCAAISKLSEGRQPSGRLAVRPRQVDTEWLAMPPDNRDFSQYAVPRASMWSGTMAKVVQVVMGIGRISTAKMRDPNAPKPDKEAGKYLNDVKTEGVQIRFDYKFSRTHGITKGADGKLWLVEISSSKGVVARLLPIFPDSDKPSFKNRAEAREDRAMVKALDELGCLPTGESMPGGDAFNRMRDAGNIIVLATADELAEFYANSGYSSACGWAFNKNGTEAHNVGYRYTDQTRLQQGVWYQINIQIGALKEDREPNEPIASGSASLVKQHDSYIRPTLDKGFCPFKYWEPLLPGLMNHNAQPLPPPGPGNEDGPSAAPNDLVDVPIFVGFINDELKVGRMFGGKSGGPNDPIETDITPGECLYDGNWTTTITTGGKSLPPMVYTNDIDLRRTLEGHVRIETLSSQSLGYDPLSWGDYIDNVNFSYVTRNKVYKEIRTVEEKGGEKLGTVLIVPGYLREGYYLMQGNSFALGHFGGSNTSYTYLTDPNISFGWRNLVPLNNFKPWGPETGCKENACGGKHKERRVVCQIVATGGCSDFADSGPFIGMCDIIDAYPPTSPTPNRPGGSSNWNKGGDFMGKNTLVMAGLGGPKEMEFSEAQWEYALVISPEPETGAIQKMWAEYSTIGEDAAIYQTEIDGLEVQTQGYLPGTLSNVDRLPAIIGVNQP